MLLAVLMQMLQRYSDFPFEVVNLAMDPGYNPENRKKIEENAALLDLLLTFFSTDIFRVADRHGGESPCYLCARMRRGHLYAKAKELGCNKIALGHHRTDVLETTLLSMFYGGQMQSMPPRLVSTNFPGMELIRPLYCIDESDILRWCTYNDLSFIRCACRFTEAAEAAGEEHRSKRPGNETAFANPKKDKSQSRKQPVQQYSSCPSGYLCRVSLGGRGTPVSGAV